MGYRNLLQKVSAALMVPVVILPIAAIYMAIGSQVGLPMVDAAGRAILISYLPLIFAIGVAISFCQHDGMAALAAAIGWVVMTQVMAAIDQSINMGALGGIISGAVTAWLYARYRTVRFPEYLGLFSGKRFVVVAASFAGLILGIAFGYIWPPLQEFIARVGDWILAAGSTGVLVYGILNRLLIPTGLHHIINNLIMYVFGSYTDPVTGAIVQGEVPRFYAGDPQSGYILAGFFITMMFAIPAITLAMTHEAKPANRAKVAGIMVTAALTSLITGITEPAEFAFMFVAPLLYVIHALLTGVALWASWLLGIRHYGYALPMYFINWGLSSKAWLIIPMGIVYFILYYFLFRFLIRRLNLPTLGRVGLLEAEGQSQAEADSTPTRRTEAYLVALGGVGNIIEVNACLTRLRVALNRPDAIDEEALRKLGATGISRPGGNNLQVIVGYDAEAIRDELRQLLFTETREEELEMTRKTVILAPLTGRVVPLSQVPDEAFASGLIGQGAAIDPAEGCLVAPADGTVARIFPGGHAVAFETDDGWELVLHLGIDTVALAGKGFTPLVSDGDRVRAGQRLVEFDPGAIRQSGKSMVSPVVIANTDRILDLRITDNDRVDAGLDRLLVVSAKSNS